MKAHTVKELIDLLSQFDNDQEIAVGDFIGDPCIEIYSSEDGISIDKVILIGD
jgi:hypothetical protein